MKVDLILKMELEDGRLIEVNPAANKYTYDNKEYKLDLPMIKIISPIYSDFMNKRLVLRDLKPYKKHFFNQEIIINKFNSLENEGKIINWVNDRYPKTRTYRKSYLCKLTDKLRDYFLYYNCQPEDFINTSDCIEIVINNNCNITLNYFGESSSIADNWHIYFVDKEDFNRFCNLLECVD